MSALVILITVVAFALLIVVHELGHFLAARACGMRVERFSVGFGPVVWKQKRGETEWAISALPLGGYVRIAGMAPDEEIKADDGAAYCNQPAWRRLLVIVAGPGMNYVAALLLAVAMALTFGVPRPVAGLVIGRPQAGSPAEAAGLQDGDRVVAIDGQKVSSWEEFVAEIVRRPGKAAQVTVERRGSPLTLTATPRDDGGAGRLGVGLGSRPEVASGPGSAVALAFAATHEQAGRILSSLGRVFTGKSKARLSGPLGIAQDLAGQARQGTAPFVASVWVLSIVLALFNLLPIPALDGGRLVFLLYELVTRRRVNEKVENYVHLAGFIALFGLILWVTITGDLMRLLRK